MPSIAVRLTRLVLASLVFASLALVAACKGSNDVTGTGGALVRLAVDAPGTARSGQQFNVDLTAQNVGVTNVRNTAVTVTLAAPLAVNAVNADAGTTATFANTANGATVSWQVNVLDSNSTSRLTIQAVGTLAPGAPNLPVAIRAQLTADGIAPGDSVADATVTLMH